MSVHISGFFNLRPPTDLFDRHMTSQCEDKWAKGRLKRQILKHVQMLPKASVRWRLGSENGLVLQYKTF